MAKRISLASSFAGLVLRYSKSPLVLLPYFRVRVQLLLAASVALPAMFVHHRRPVKQTGSVLVDTFVSLRVRGLGAMLRLRSKLIAITCDRSGSLLLDH